ncbi:glycosyltransferase family 4 protein [Patescibacteria group bacterium]|nr:MAG: glycosyltransferase family 4 protein [Patescibacteria group bacterium]
MKLALVHDYLIQDGGAEKVVDVMHGLWPDAPLYTLLFDPTSLPAFAGRDIRTSFLERLPFGRRKYQWYLPLMPTATEHYDLSDYDVVLSSTSAFAKGVLTREDALHICYCHTPTRYLWSDTHSYIEELRVPRIVKMLLPPLLTRLRMWDRQAADRVDVFIANSQTVRRRIQKYYGREATVIHPPVDTHRFSISNEPKKYFLTGGRLVAYKRYDLVIEAANRTGIPLKIFGSGPVERDLKRMAKSHIEFLGRVSDEEQATLYAGARAFIHPQEEDFGITPVESMAAGRPVIAWRKGGATETVQEGLSGQFFDEQSWEELADYMIRFREADWNPNAIKAYAETFSRERFERELVNFVETSFSQGLQPRPN